MFKDMIAQGVFTTAVLRLTKAAAKNGVDRDEAVQVFSAIVARVYPENPKGK